MPLDADQEFDSAVQAGAEPATPSQPTAPAEQPPPVSPLIEQARSFGLELGEDIKDSDGLAKYLLQQYTQQRPYAEFGRSALSGQQQVNQGSNAESKQEEEDSEGAFDEHKFFSEAWSVPELSQGAQWALKAGAFQEGEHGMLVPVPGLEQAALPYVKEVNDYQQSRARLNESFAQNPVKFLAEKLLPYFEHKFGGKFQELSQQSVQTFEQQLFVDKFRAANASWLYTPDGTAFTPQGQRFAEAVDLLTQRGLSLQEATEMVLSFQPPRESKPSESPPAPEPPGKEAGERQRDEHGRFLPAGTPDSAGQPKSFLEKAKERAMASPAGRATTEHTVVASEGDLDEMWMNAWRQHAGA